ncbi:hypothetical protein GGI11_001720 [Coemansia sp. RSA 2049]|nr:hypothetical protein GGI11_001720 [Coemansia sp. RSA 2049]
MQLLSKTSGAFRVLGGAVSARQRHALMARQGNRCASLLFSTKRDAPSPIKHGLVVGIVSVSDTHELYGAEAAGLTAAQQQQIVRQVHAVGSKAREGSVQVVYARDGDDEKYVAVVGLGSKEDAHNGGGRGEVVRTAVANGVRQLCAQNTALRNVTVGPMPCHQASAEGAKLALYKFDGFKTKNTGSSSSSSDGGKNEGVAVTHLASQGSGSGAGSWDTGVVYAEAQNLARDLMNTPANFMTPTIFADRVREALAGIDGVSVSVYDKAWAEAQRMGGLLAVSRGSDEPLRFVEVVYSGGDAGSGVELALVGKGVTYDTGGYSLKPSRYMDMMKGDMGGGATVVSAIRAIAQLRLPINVVATVPLCENMVNGSATKVSDVYTSRAGMTVEVMNTDAEGRIILADALNYTIETHQPRTIVDVATLTGAMVVALGEVYTGVFTPSPRLWGAIEQASSTSDEPVWRMPLHDRWDAMLRSPVADLSNIGNKAEAGACTAAAFLRQFVVDRSRTLPLAEKPMVLRAQNNDESLPRWAHMDIAGPMEASASTGYHQKGLSGRPTRMLVDLARILATDPLP